MRYEKKVFSYFRELYTKLLSLPFSTFDRICCHHMQSNQEKLQKDKQWMPDLRLSLSQRDGNNDGKTDHCRETQEINTKLSLS